MKVKCNKADCKYEWEYKGKSKFYVTCPQCHKNIKINEGDKSEENK